MTDQLPILIPLPMLVMALVIPVVARSYYWAAFPLSLLGVGAAALASAWALAVVLDDGPFSYELGAWPPPLGIEYVVDHVAAFVSVVVTSVATLVIIATRRWADRNAGDRLGSYYGLVMLLVAGLAGMVVTGDLFNLFVFLEISSLAAYALVFLGGRRGMLAGFRYLIIGSIGGSFYLLGVGFLYFATGTLNMAEMREILTDDATNRSVMAGAIFIFVGLGLKMALVPMHLWLPDAYTYAPSSVNSLLAPIMTKVAAYSIIRMFISVFPEGYLIDEVPIGPTFVVLGIAGVLLGAIGAFFQTDFRRLLAYSSIGQLGLIAIGAGLGSPLALAAALLHVMNHAVMKAGLFLIGGNVRFTTGRSDLQTFVGLSKTMPITMASFVLIGLAMVGVPPLVGFFSKFYLAEAAINADNWVVLAVVVFSGLLSAAYLFRVMERAYLTPTLATDTDAGVAPAEPSNAKEPPVDMVAIVVLFAVAAVVLGFFNGLIMTEILEPGVAWAQGE